MRSGTPSLLCSGLLLVSVVRAATLPVVVSRDFRSLPPGFPFLFAEDGIRILSRDEGFFLLDADGKPRRLFQTPAPAALPAVEADGPILCFLEDGSLLRVDLASDRTERRILTDRRFLSAGRLQDGTVVYLTDDAVLYRLDPVTAENRPFGFTPSPLPDAFVPGPGRLLVRCGPSRFLRFGLPQWTFQGYTNIPSPPDPFPFRPTGGMLFHRSSTSEDWRPVGRLPSSSPTVWLATNRGRLLYASAEGSVRVFSLPTDALPTALEPPRRLLREGWSVMLFPDETVLTGPCGRWRLPSAPAAAEPCVEAVCEDLDGDGQPDAALLFDANRTMSYRRIVLAFSSAPSQEFTTILEPSQGLARILRDLDGDGRKELVLVKEMNLNLDVRPDRRLLVPEVYRMERHRGFVWASYRYPAFYEAQQAETRRRIGTRPFRSEAKNRIWREMNTVILGLQTELVTLNRQIAQARSRPRDARSRAGLSLWYYKKGLEMFRNRWDNLALLAFRHSLEQDPSNPLPAFQAGRIYAEYGMFAEAARMLGQGRASDIVFVQNQNYYRMKEDLFPVLFDPPPFYRHYHAGEVLFATADYRKAAAAFRKALAEATAEHPMVFRDRARLMLADSLMALQRFSEAAALYESLEQRRPGMETAHKLRLARRLAATVRPTASR